MENSAGSTPAVDSAGRIYAIFNWGTAPDGSDWSSALVCFNRLREEQWRYQPPPWGPDSLPSILHGGPKIWQQPGGEMMIFFILQWIEFSANLLHSFVVVVNEYGIPQSTAQMADTWIFSTRSVSATSTESASPRLPSPRTELSMSSPRTSSMHIRRRCSD